MKKLKTLLLDIDGNLSSKRTAAFTALVVVCFVAGYAIVKDPSQAGNILWPLAIFGSACLGVTIGERKK